MEKCLKCGAEFKNIWFCPKCGEIVKFPSFIEKSKNEKLEKGISLFVKDLVESVNKQKKDITDLVSSDAKLCDAVFRNTYEKILQLEKICSRDDVKEVYERSGASIIDKLKAFATKCKENECYVAIAGTIKAGKSTFINAVVGTEVASSYPTPETASLTKFRFSEKGNFVKVTFYSESEWAELMESVKNSKRFVKSVSENGEEEDFMSEYKRLNAESVKSNFVGKGVEKFENLAFDEMKNIVEKYTAARYAEHFFAKEVEVGLERFNVPKNVVFVDTPGLGDPVEYRSKITRKYLSGAHVVLLCVKAASAEMREAEVAEITKVFETLRYKRERIYVFGTQVDVQTEYLDYWEKHTKPEFKKYLKSEARFGDMAFDEDRIMPVSAFAYLLAKEAGADASVWNDPKKKKALKDIVNRSVEDDEDMSPKQLFEKYYDRIIEQTNVDYVTSVLINSIVRKAEEIIKEDVKDDYLFISERLKDCKDREYSIIEETVKSAEEGRLTEDIKEMKEGIAKREDKYRKLKSDVDKMLNEIKEKLKD